MNNDSRQELLALHALGCIDQDETTAAENLLRSDTDSRALFRELEDSLAELALAVDPVEPPAGLRDRILDHLPPRAETSPVDESGAKVIAFPATATKAWIPWSLAACFALICGLVLQNNLSLRDELSTLASGPDLESIKVATLSSMMAAAPRAQAVAVWDGSLQEGVLTLSSLPPLEENKDYQLWIIDPRYENPVDGGVFNVSAQGETRYRFKSNQTIETISAFAVSLERKGGVPKAEGPMVLISRT